MGIQFKPELAALQQLPPAAWQAWVLNFEVTK